VITRIEALNYRCLRYVRQDLSPFHVLVGPNASGKTTFLDVVEFLGRLVSDGLEAAIGERTQNFHDLLWRRKGDRFELAVEFAIPEEKRRLFQKPKFDTIRYEIAAGFDVGGRDVALLGEKALLKVCTPLLTRQRELFPLPLSPPETLLTKRSPASSSKAIMSKGQSGEARFASEVIPGSGKGWIPSYDLGPRRSGLANLPADQTRFPVATWLRETLSEGVHKIVLNSLEIRKASPPLRIHGFRPDGSNLPWVIESLQRTSSDRFKSWIAHLRTALPDIEDIRTTERPDDKYRYLTIRYVDGLDVPSWMASDGTLRLLALTLPAYVAGFQGIYLIEEPENGIHPRAVETMFESLSSVYDGQILMATHSPVILSIADPASILCFAKADDEATDIVLGSEHPALRDWQGETNLSDLFAAGVLG
jgi:predicted ATPase